MLWKDFHVSLKRSMVYNDNKRLHSALDYRSPNEFGELPTIQKNMEVPRQTLLALPVQSQGCTPLNEEEQI